MFEKLVFSAVAPLTEVTAPVPVLVVHPDTVIVWARARSGVASMATPRARAAARLRAEAPR
jgi:hypothetical protein